MRYFLIALFILLFYYSSSAKKETSNHLTYDEYILEYGIDSKSVAIIDLFFNKRNLSGIGQMSFLPVSSSVAIIVPPIGLALMAISSPLFINGLLIRNKYSHKNLLVALEYYQNNNLLSNRFKKKINRILHNKKLDEIENTNAERYFALKEINQVSSSNYVMVVK